MKRALCLLLLAVMVSTASAENLVPKGNFWNKRGYFLMRIGFIGGSNFKLDGAERDGQTGFTFGAALEFRVLRNWHFGVGGDVHRLHISDSGQYFFDGSITLKRFLFSTQSKIAFRPGIALGYATMDYFTRLLPDVQYGVERIERTHYLVWKGTLEVVFFDEHRVAPYVEVGMMGTAYGGNRQHDVSIGPFPYFRGGLMF